MIAWYKNFVNSSWLCITYDDSAEGHPVLWSVSGAGYKQHPAAGEPNLKSAAVPVAVALFPC